MLSLDETDASGSFGEYRGASVSAHHVVKMTSTYAYGGADGRISFNPRFLISSGWLLYAVV